VSSCELIVVGGSWGGLGAVSQLLGGLPADLPVPVVVVLHRAADSTQMLGAALARVGPLPVREAEDKDLLEPGNVFLAPSGYHLLVERGHLALSTEEAVRFSRPSIDVTFETAADAYGPGTVGVVLSGANDDGSAGLAEIRRRGGIAVVQDPETAERSTMPAAAVLAATPQAVLPVEAIAALLAGLARTTNGNAREVRG
jgi:two-component system chemotaxis response regulator CheB